MTEEYITKRAKEIAKDLFPNKAPKKKKKQKPVAGKNMIRIQTEFLDEWVTKEEYERYHRNGWLSGYH